jgi:hypothetical protein
MPKMWNIVVMVAQARSGSGLVAGKRPVAYRLADAGPIVHAQRHPSAAGA